MLADLKTNLYKYQVREKQLREDIIFLLEELGFETETKKNVIHLKINDTKLWITLERGYILLEYFEGQFYADNIDDFIEVLVDWIYKTLPDENKDELTQKLESMRIFPIGVSR